ncbi:MAG: hypothetical protein GF346_06810 [Candidatus Eisenbacteria bacterium]|nr:hypothetical protein [Candidatus Latescibacterota bacterium]MBD3302139.1 hypothetical protein [Candidatus Eisenbacteria bacterium]
MTGCREARRSGGIRHPWILALYAAAMGILEAAVVVYLRALYYPDGFGFPLGEIEPPILRVEIVREAMTLVMIGAVAVLAAARPWSRLVAFLIVFGLWDITYYAGLKLFLAWPASLVEPDILFLIPKEWIGPVLAPMLVSLAWVVGGFLLHDARPEELRMRATDWIGGTLACGLILVSFLVPVGPPEDPGFLWSVFLAGLLLGSGILARLRRNVHLARSSDGPGGAIPPKDPPRSSR